MTENIERIGFRHSFATRVSMWMLGMTGLVFLLSFCGASWFAGKMMLIDGHKKANLELDKAILNITDDMDGVETAGNNFSTFLRWNEVETFAPNAFRTVLADFLKANPDVQGAAVCFEPEYFTQYSEGFAPYLMQFRKGDTKYVNLADVYKYRTTGWYRKAKSKGYSFWTEAFKEANGTIVSSYIVPLANDEGNFIGVLALDMSLQKLSDEVQEQKPYPQSFITVMDKDFNFLVHPDKKMIMNGNVHRLLDRKRFEVNESIMIDMKHQRRGVGAFAVDGDTKFLYYAPIKRCGWTVALECDKDEIMEEVTAVRLQMAFISVAGLLLLLVISFFLMRKLLLPIRLYSKAAHRIAKGKFNTHLQLLRSHDELWVLGNALDHMQHSLEKYINELKVTTQAKGRIESELNIASKIQMSMIPKIFPPYPEREDLDVYATLIPAKAVGGDLYDFFLRDEKLFFCIGDVSGKGVPASLVMAVTRSLLRIVATQESRPDRIVASLNTSMSDMNETNMFVTLFVGVLDLPTGRFRYCNAGHNAPVLIEGETREVKMLDVKPNLPIAIMSKWNFELQETYLTTDSVLFMYTDGLTEAENATQELFGEDRMMEVLKETENKSTKEQIDTMLETVRKHVNGAEQSDDLTMVSLGYRRQERDTKFYRKRTLHNDIRETPKIADFIDDIVGETGIDMALACSLNLALEEAVVNVMNYAYPQGKVGNITLESYAFDGSLKFVITDNGIPFDPTRVKDPDVTSGIEERQVGGLGIFLVNRIMDKVEYKRMNNTNILTLSKKLEIEPPKR